MSTFLVTGTTRGLGLSLVQVLSSMPSSVVSTVFAATRSETPGADLSQTIESANGRVKHLQIEVDSEDSVRKAFPIISSSLEGRGLDYLINNAAVREPEPIMDLRDLDTKTLEKTLTTNILGTHDVIRTMLPLLQEGQAKTIINFSSTLGAITTSQSDPHMAGVPLPAYKISKAGTHMITALWSNQLKTEGFCVYMQSPGNLRTKLSGGESSDLPIEVGAKETIRIALEAKPEDTGRHRNILVKGWENGGGRGGRYDGLDLPW